MSDTENANVLRRMAHPAEGTRDTAKSPWSGIWQVVVPRAADEEIGVEVGLIRAKQHELPLAKLLDELGETGLILRLGGPNDFDGLAHIDIHVLAALLEAQTLGRVLSGEAAERTGTRTDAAVVTPMINRWITASEEETEARDELPPPWAGLRVTGRLAERRAVELAIDDGRFSVAGLQLGFDGGAKLGTLTIAARSSGQQNQAGAAKAKAALTDTVMAARARMDVVLDRSMVPIGWVRKLQPGDTLEVARSRLSHTWIEAHGGKLVAAARLGQAGGQRAVRLNLDGDLDLDAALDNGSMALEGGAPSAMPMDMPALEGGGVPDLPGGDLPDLPGGDLPDLPDLPEGDLPDLPGGDLPDLPGGDLPDLPGGDLPDLPDLPGGDLPELPGGDLPDLPGGDLPDLPDLPPLE